MYKTIFNISCSILLISTTLFSDENIHINELYKNAYSSITQSALISNANQEIQDNIKKEYSKYSDIVDINNNKSELTIFYFVDSLVDNVSIENFSNAINKLTNHNLKVDGKVMFRGLINDSFKESGDFVLKLKENNNVKNIEFYPIHFHSFKYFKLSRVPAYALSVCNNNNFKFSECNHKYLIRGNIALQSFFQLLMEENKEYEDYYYTLLEKGMNKDE